jgi:hypothetical protein
MTRPALRAIRVEATRRRVHRKFGEARIYRALAEREPCERVRAVLHLSARASERAAWRAEERLWHLGVVALPAHDGWRSRLWRWLLVRAGKRAALEWLAWLERRDHSRLFSLLDDDH